MVIPIRDENPTRHTPVLTLAFLAVNVVVFLFIQPNSPFQTATDRVEAQRQAIEEQRFLYEHAAVPCEITRLRPLTVAQLETRSCDPGSGAGGSREVFPGKNVLLSIVSSMFMHGGLLHLGGNMLFLWIFGNNVEDRLRPVGFALFYFAGGVAATLAHVLTNTGSLIPLVGASGAIAAIMGAYLVWWPRARILSVVPIFFLIHLVRLPAGLVLGLWFVLQFLTNPNSGVAWAAHVGGFIVGVAIGWLLGPPRTGPRPGPSPARP